MKFENQYNLPKHILKLLPKIYKPKENRISISHLIDAPRIRTLLLERWDDIIRDYSDLILTLLGISVHDRVEKLAEEDEQAEEKLENVIDGIPIVGKADVYTNGIIRDVKVTALGRLNFEDIIKKYIAQTNCYAWQRRKRNQKINALYIDVFYRDWKLINYIRSTHKLNGIFCEINGKRAVDGYPPVGYFELKLPLWSFEEQEQYIKNQIEYHLMGKYECSDEDRWKSETTYAIMKKGRKSAVIASVNGKKILTKQQANDIIVAKNLDKNHYIEIREGKCLRCELFCSVRSVCKFSPYCIEKYRIGD